MEVVFCVVGMQKLEGSHKAISWKALSLSGAFTLMQRNEIFSLQHLSVEASHKQNENYRCLKNRC